MRLCPYLARIQQVHDELSIVGEVVNDFELVKEALRGCAKQWTVFVEGILARQ